jgi:branched-chain amino acid transport system substrate-binding protein
MFLVGREIWREETNAKGGLLGRPVEFVYYDDQSNPGAVPAIYSKLIDVDKVDLVVSPFATTQIAPAMPVIMQKQMTFMALFGTGVNDTFKYDRYFQILPNGPDGIRSFSLGFFETALTMEPKPRTLALVGEDTEFGQNVLTGARANAEQLGLKIVHDRTFPPTTADHTPIVRAVQAADPDVLFVASYATGSVGMVRVVSELGYKPRLFGGAMIGLQFTPIKAQLGPLLNGIVINENYVPEPTMHFPGVDDVIKRYQERAATAGTDPLGFWSPFAYAEMQILGQSVGAVGSTDQGKLADYLHATRFNTVVGDVKFGPAGRMGEVAHPLHPISEHQGERSQSVPPARQGRDPVAAGIQIGGIDLSLRQGARLGTPRHERHRFSRLSSHGGTGDRRAGRACPARRRRAAHRRPRRGPAEDRRDARDGDRPPCRWIAAPAARAGSVRGFPGGPRRRLRRHRAISLHVRGGVSLSARDDPSSQR